MCHCNISGKKKDKLLDSQVKAMVLCIFDAHYLSFCLAIFWIFASSTLAFSRVDLNGMAWQGRAKLGSRKSPRVWTRTQ